MFRKGLTTYLRTFPCLLDLYVLPEKKILYMRTPKTGSSSILKSLIPYTGGWTCKKASNKKFEEWLSSITDKELENYFIFTFVRNPWDRAVSAAAYTRININTFLNGPDTVKMNQNQKRHTRPQHLYAYIDNNCFCDFIGRFEQLEEDFTKLTKLLGLKEDIKLVHIQSSNHKSYKLYYDKLKKINIEKYYKKSVDFFNYVYE